MQPASLARVVLPLPCPASLALTRTWGPPAASLIRRLQGKARQDTTRRRQHRRASLAESNGMPNFTWLAAGAPWAVDWRRREALAVAAMIGRA